MSSLHSGAASASRPASLQAVVTSEFRDELATCTSMGVNKSGTLALVAGRNSVGVVDLDSPHQPRSVISRPSRQDVSDIRFSYERDDFCAVAHGDKIEMLEVSGPGDVVSVSKMKAASRSVTDLSFHRQNTNIIASSSTDPFIKVWDVRQPTLPTHTLSTMQSAVQVCWERVDGHVLASAHDCEVKLWDIRKGDYPLHYVNAHVARILGLDFSCSRRGRLVTASDDNTLKFWEVGSAEVVRQLHIIRVPQAPVWKLRYAPFGNGLVTLMLHSLFRGENSATLWNANHLDAPVHSFLGHTEIILEFGWRKRDVDRGRLNYELVTWSKDATMKIWPVGKSVTDMCGQVDEDDEDERGMEADDDNDDDGRSTSRPGNDELVFGMDQTRDDDLTSPNADCGVDSGEYSCTRSTDSPSMPTAMLSSAATSEMGDRTASIEEGEEDEGDEEDDSRPSSSRSSLRRSHKMSEDCLPEVMASSAASSVAVQPTDMQHEFQVMTLSDNVVLDKVDAEERVCVIVAEIASSSRLKMQLSIRFPDNYPNGEMPRFEFLAGTTVEPKRLMEIKERLEQLARAQVAKGRRCLEVCLRQFETAVEELSQREEMGSQNGEEDFISPPKLLGGLKDSNVPFPRSSGARFCGNGKLVLFFTERSMSYMDAGQLSSSAMQKTPRSLSALIQIGCSPPTKFGSLKRNGPRFSKRQPRKPRMPSFSSTVSEDPTTVPEDFKFKVTTYNTLKIQPFSVELANRYYLCSPSVSLTCEANAGVVQSLRQKIPIPSLAQFISLTWALLASVTRTSEEGLCARERPLTAKCVNTQMTCSCPLTDRQSGLPEDKSRTPKTDSLLRPWAQSPLARKMVEARLLHHLKMHDFQTVAAVVCVLDRLEMAAANHNNVASGNGAMGTIRSQPLMHSISTDSAFGGVTLSPAARGRKVHSQPRMNRFKASRSECLEIATGRDGTMEAMQNFRATWVNRSVSDGSVAEEALDGQISILVHDEEDETDSEIVVVAKPSDNVSDENAVRVRDEERRLLDPKNRQSYETAKQAYAAVLHDMGLHLKAAEVSKLTQSDADATTHFRVSVRRACTHCRQPVTDGNVCGLCAHLDLGRLCVVCNVTVRGLMSACLFCGHGGHTQHLRDWFLKRSDCPTGCGCRCLELIGDVGEPD